MAEHKIYSMAFSTVYPHYVVKAERKNRTKAEVDEIIFWLTGYDSDQLDKVILDEVDFRHFFANAPNLNESRQLITGKVCGVVVEDIEDPLMQNIRYLDKLIDELAKGRPLEKILRS